MRSVKKVDRLKKSASIETAKEKAKKHIPRKLKIQRVLAKGIRTARNAAKEYEELNEVENSTQYAGDKSVQIVRDASSKAVPIVADGTIRIVRGTVKAGKTAFRFAKERTIRLKVKSIRAKLTGNKKPAPAASRPAAYHAGQKRAMQAARYRGQQPVMRQGAKTGRTVETYVKTGNSTVKSAPKTIKLVTRSIKTVRSAASTAKAAANTARTAAKAAPRAMQLLKMAGKAAIIVAKLAAKTIIAAGKALVAAAQALGAFLAAGGGLVVVIAIVVGLIAYLFGGAFGILFTDEAEHGALTQAIVDIQIDFSDQLQAEIDRLSASGVYDAVLVHYDGDYDGDSRMANNWTDVLAVYAVKMQYDGSEVMSIDPQKQVILRQIFESMNIAAYRTEVESDTYTVDDEEYTTSTLHIHITISSMDYLEGAAFYHFTPGQIALLEELMSSEFYELFADVLNVDMYGGISKAELTGIINNLPAGTKGAAIVQGAASKIGTPYSKLDCSKLVQAVYAEAGVSLPRTSVAQAQYCYENGYAISASQVQPGDLIFWSKPDCSCGRWQEVHHVGIYIGNGQIIDASSGKGRVVLRDVWQGAGYEIFMYARL